MTRNTICLIALMITVSGCIEPYVAKIDAPPAILVVEGIISDGISPITLSRSVGLDSVLYYGATAVNNAIVYVECEDGTASPIAYTWWDGRYNVETGRLKPDAKYRLVILLDDQKYCSEFLTPAVSPPLEVSFSADNYFINVHVSTKGDAHQPGYYLWSFREDWETTAALYNSHVYINGRRTPNIFNGVNHYYCWKRDTSYRLILGTTEKLTENTIDRQIIHTFTRFEDRTSNLYRIRVRQHTLHREAYEFLNNIKKNAEQSGSIFGPIPSEISGNIRCETDPDIPVIGYVDVSSTSTDEQYLDTRYYNTTAGYRIVMDCLAMMIVDPPEPLGYGSGYIYYEEIDEPGKNTNAYINEACVDCVVAGGSKEKPKDWPNNHR